MKIKTDDLTRTIADQAQKSARQKGAKFDEILQKSIGTPAEPQGPVANVSGSHVEDARAVAGIHGIRLDGVPEEQQGPILDRVERLLDTLEEYERELRAPSTPGETLVSIVDRMEEHNRGLASILVTLPEGDPLKDILNRVLITSVVEVEKFRRGDYP
jgi:hypothetical protein